MIEPHVPGMPWRKCTPQVSWSFNLVCKTAFSLRYPIAEINPITEPQTIGIQVLVNMSAAAPITTPPARVELSKTSISSLPVMRREVYIATKVDEVIDIKVLTTARCYCKPEPRIALNEGQYMKRKIVPIIAMS